MRGVLITFEGPEGSGKSTQAGRLAAALSGKGVNVLRVREPGGTPVGEAIRRILQHDAVGSGLCPEAEVLLFAASRAQLVRGVILPAIEEGTCVVCDRFADSTTVYQGFGRGLGVEKMLAINAFAVDGAVPDITILLDVDVDQGFRRIEKRNAEQNTGHDRFEREDLSFHEKVRRGYLELANRWPDRFRVIDGRLAEESVAEAVWQAVWSRIADRPLARAAAR